MSSVPSRKLVEEVSPRSGRKNVAHGVSRGSMRFPSRPSPLPPERERGVRQPTDGVRAAPPRACALGYYPAPLTGLRDRGPHEEDFINELLIRDISLRLRLPHFARPNLFGGD